MHTQITILFYLICLRCLGSQKFKCPIRSGFVDSIYQVSLICDQTSPVWIVSFRPCYLARVKIGMNSVKVLICGSPEKSKATILCFQSFTFRISSTIFEYTLKSLTPLFMLTISLTRIYSLYFEHSSIIVLQQSTMEQSTPDLGVVLIYKYTTLSSIKVSTTMLVNFLNPCLFLIASELLLKNAAQKSVRSIFAF